MHEQTETSNAGPTERRKRGVDIINYPVKRLVRHTKKSAWPATTEGDRTWSCSWNTKRLEGIVRHQDESVAQVAALKTSEKAKVAWTARDAAKARISGTLVTARPASGGVASEEPLCKGWLPRLNYSGLISTLGFRCRARTRNIESNSAVPYASRTNRRSKGPPPDTRL